MTDMNFFDGFSFTWSSEGPVAQLTQEAVKAGWGFIGQTPPAVEQFNAVHQQDGQRQQYLFRQIQAVTSASGMQLTAGATDTLWLAIKAKLDLKQDGIGYTPVQQGGGTGQGSNKVYIGWGGGSLRGQVDGTDLGSFVFAGRQFTAGAGLTGGGTFDSDRTLSMGTPSTITSTSQNAAGGNTHTHAFNVQLQDMGGTLPVGKGGTGAGNPDQARANLGLNSFLALAASSREANGFMELASNDGSFSIILQWGQATVPGDSDARVNWPRAFPNRVLNAWSCLGFIFSPTGDAGCSIRDLDASGGTIRQGTADAGVCRFFAIGY